jgi:pyrroline-5-carboxylate reductase
METMDNQRIGFIGAGQMARALGSGFVSAGVVQPGQILLADPSPTAVEDALSVISGAATAKNNTELVTACDIVFLAVKPHILPTVLNEIGGRGEGKLFVSIVAGVKLAALANGLNTKRIIRVMPNTPCLVGSSASGFCAGTGAGDSDVALIETLLSAVGYAVRIEERQMDALTGLSGSGPAYVYQIIEALSDGGVKRGLPRDIATALAAHTVRGAAEMVLRTGEHPGVLKDRVASPGGTTIAGLMTLEQYGLRAALMSAVDAAAERSAELGN